MKQLLLYGCIMAVLPVTAQVKWQNADSGFGQLPAGFHVFKTTDSLDQKPFIAYYASVALKEKKLHFTADTTDKRRFTPQQFFEKNNQPLLVVNCTFFNFDRNQNLNLVMKDGKLVSYNVHTVAGKGKDTLTYRHPFGSAIGISKKRKADIDWLFTDSASQKAYSYPYPGILKDSADGIGLNTVKLSTPLTDHRKSHYKLRRWKMQTAVGGGPVVLQNGTISITNEKELKFSGRNGLTDKHPRTCMGYTADGRLIIMVIQGRSADAAGATLVQEAQLLKDLGCVEALNLDGGGSSCMLINGKPTIKVSDKEGQRPVPAVFIVY